MKTEHLKYIVEEDTTFEKAMHKILMNKCREVLVVSGKKVKGTLSEGDILKAFINGTQISSQITNHCNRNFKYLEQTNNYKANALKYFLKYNINLIPIVNKNFELKDVVVIKQLLKK